MFYTLAVLSMLGYSLQGTLLVRYARSMDGQSLTFYRNVSFVITLLPLLVGSSFKDIEAVFAQWPVLTIAGLSGGLFLALSFASYRFLSVGVKTTFGKAMLTLLVLLFGWVLFGERPSPLALTLIGSIVIILVWLGLERNPMEHLEGRARTGIFLVLASTVFLAITKAALTFLTRTADPLTVGYFWEASIAAATLVVVVLRWALGGRSIERARMATIADIALRSWPTLIGTGAFVLAVSRGPLVIAEAIGGGAIALSAILAHFLYGEHLTQNQWIAILLVMIAVAGLKFV